MTPNVELQAIKQRMSGAAIAPEMPFSEDEEFDEDIDEVTAKKLIAELYWAARPGDDVVKELMNKEREWVDGLRDHGMLWMWRMAKAQWQGQSSADARAGFETQQIGFDGEEGELIRFRINEVRSYFKQILNMAMQTRPAFSCSAIHDDYDSVSQAKKADGLVTYVFKAKYGEVKERKTYEYGGLFGISWTWIAWDNFSGADYTDDNGKKAKAGDVVIKSRASWEVFHDLYVSDQDEHLWRCVREHRSKWEVLATFKHEAERISKLSTVDHVANELMGLEYVPANSDRVVVKHWYHARCPALPEGRYICYAGDVVLKDGPLPYDEIPLYEFCPSEFIGLSLGYADIWDICSINEMIDQVFSDVASNITAFGRQCIWMEEGTDYPEDAIADGLRGLVGPIGSTPPQAVSLAEVPAASQWFADILEKKMQAISGLNSVVRGSPDANITSGTMAALFHSVAVEFNSAYQAAVDTHRERIANAILKLIKRNAKQPVVAKMIGSDERSYQKSFSADELSSVDSVEIRTANPLMRSQAGRMELARMMLEMKAVETPDQLTEVLITGQLKPITDGPMSRRLRIRYENETLQKKPPVTERPSTPTPGMNPEMAKRLPPTKWVELCPVSFLDDHVAHIHEHETLLAPGGAMQDAKLRQAVMAHIQDHFDVWAGSDPEKCRLLGQAMPPQPAMPPAPQGGQGRRPPPNGAHRGGQGSVGANIPKGAIPSGMKNPGSLPEKDSTGIPVPKPAQSPV